MNINKKNWWLGGSISTTDVFAIIGDSLASGASNNTGLGPTTPAGSCFESDGTTLTELTTADLSTSTANNGTPWKQFALDYYNATGRTVVFVNGASSGSEFYPYLDNNNWYTSGTLYSALKTKLDNTLTNFPSYNFKGFLMVLGINDIRSGNTSANVKLGIDSLFSRLNTDYPNKSIWAASFGRSEAYESSLNNLIRWQVKKYFMDAIETYSQARLATNLIQFTNTGWTGYGADNLHLTQTGNNLLGTQFYDAVVNTESNQQVANVINCFYQKPTGTRLTAYKTFIEGLVSDGNWDKLDSLFLFKTDHINNIIVPFRGYGTAQLDGCTLNSNESITTGTNKRFRSNFRPSYNQNYSSQNDIIVGAKLLTNNAAAGVDGGLFGSRNGMRSRVCQTVASQVLYNMNDNTDTVYAETKMADNTYYSIYRNGTTKGLMKDTTSVDSAVVTSTGNSDFNYGVGYVNQSDTTILQQLNAKIQCFYIAKYSTLSVSNLQSRIDTLLAAL